MTVHLLVVDESNWRECSELRTVEEEKEFISPNVYALAERKFETESIFRAVYSDSLLVGMLAYYLHDGKYGSFYWLFHLMIETQFQGNGYGRAALKLAVKEMCVLGAREIRTMHVPGNLQANIFYKKIGFLETGDTMDGGDIFLRLPQDKWHA